VGDDSHFVFRQKLLGEDESMRRGVVMVKQPGLFSPKFGKTSSHVFTQSPQKVTVEPGIRSLACWDRCFALPQLLYRWRRHSGIFWIPPPMRVPLLGLLIKETRVRGFVVDQAALGHVFLPVFRPSLPVSPDYCRTLIHLCVVVSISP
jgi:hypothetical protein